MTKFVHQCCLGDSTSTSGWLHCVRVFVLLADAVAGLEATGSNATLSALETKLESLLEDGVGGDTNIDIKPSGASQLRGFNDWPGTEMD
jgi:hypothetical protein